MKRFRLSLGDLVEAVGDLLKKRKQITVAGTITIYIEMVDGEANAVNVEFVPR